jgi:hypothetical protein
MSVRLPPDTDFTPKQLSELAAAVEVIGRLLPGHDLRFVERQRQSALPFGGVNGEKTNRQKVIEATTTASLSIKEIADATGIKNESAIRGVVNAADLTFEGDKTGGITRYRFLHAGRDKEE